MQPPPDNGGAGKLPKGGVPSETLEAVAEDSGSQEEHRSFTDEYYERLEAKWRFNRKQHVHWMTKTALWLVFVFYTISAFVWLFHLLVPEKYMFMEPENFKVLQNLLFGTLVGGVLSQWSKKIFDD